MEENRSKQKEKLLCEDEYYSELPPGCRFKPTDEELIVYYLKNKILNQALPPHMIREVNVYDYHPQKIAEMYPLNQEKVWYFFMQPRPKIRGGRETKNGYWRTWFGKMDIVTEGQRVGFKHALTFHEGKWKSGISTQWKMHEYSLDLKRALSTSRAPDDMKLDDWVLCKIYISECGNKNRQPDNEGMMVAGPSEVGPNAVPKTQSHRGLPQRKRSYHSGVYNTNSKRPTYTERSEAHGCLDPIDLVPGGDVQPKCDKMNGDQFTDP